jgi:tetratricopeptide (TPR) repeat protein
MAAATGSVVGLILGSYHGVLIGTYCGVFGGQLAALRNFFGDRRGQFEYEYCRSCALKEAKRALIKTIGWFSCQKLYLSELGEISWSEGEHYERIIKNSTLENKDRYYMYIRAAYVLTGKRKYENSIANLEKANELYPTALVSNFMIAQSYERLGEAEKAISAYEKAMNDPCTKSIKITKYLNDQIQRVQTKGPSKKPPMGGLRHLGMGR